jgi:predicted dehydrogenase
MSEPKASAPDRRSFLKQTSAVMLAGAAELSLARGAHAAGSDLIRVGLIGCGGRGTGAAVQALSADPNTELVALGDVFADALHRSHTLLKSHEKIGPRVKVSDDCLFTGFDAYQQVIAAGVDVVLLAAPPHFRPQHLEAAVKAGKHVFAEKPVAVDAPGVERVLAACEEAKRKNLSVVSGLCWRYDLGARASVQQIHDGAVGEIVALEASYDASLPGKKWPMVRETGWSDMEWQLRNWYWFTWLSGDHIVEQAVHSLDKIAWVMHDQPPLAAESLGGLQARQGPELGDIYDHHSVTYDYPGGIKLYFRCRQQVGTSNDVSSHVYGTKAHCHIEGQRNKGGRIDTRSGEVLWHYTGPKNIMHQTEHDEMYAALRAGRTTNDGKFMSQSTMLAILGRMASYTGRKITWEEALKSKEDLSPAKYEWGPAPKIQIAIPGVTKFA